MLLALLFIASDCGPNEYWDEPMHMCMATSDSAFTDSNPGRYDAMLSPETCEGYFHFGMAMCLPKPKALGTLSAMIMGNFFAVESGETGARGVQAFAAPNWLMANAGADLASWNRLELDLMLTAELWTLPARGYPELLQIGESDAHGQPFVDRQHPHSSPVMGLSLSDVISFSRTKRRLLRVWFAPRGESTDGPIAFMHRATGTVNPDAPLGHHVGEDVGHVSSTVIAAAAFIDETTLEASTFHGQEPEPTQIDLPIGAPDSFALRLSQNFGAQSLGAQNFSPQATASASFAYVHHPEADPSITHDERLSASVYLRWSLPHAWRLHATLIWGGIAGYDHTKFMSAFTAESAVLDRSNTFFSRTEVLQRTPAELLVSGSHVPEWVAALSIGYTRRIISLWRFDLSGGAEVTTSFLPGNFSPAYGGPVQATFRVYLEARWMMMFAKDAS